MRISRGEGGGVSMSKAHDASAAARRKANEVLTKKQDNERTDARDKQRQAEDAKTAKLKALRLAKEAADKVARETTGKRSGGARLFRLARRAADADDADEGARGSPAQEHPGDGPGDHVQDLAAGDAQGHRADAGNVPGAARPRTAEEVIGAAATVSGETRPAFTELNSRRVQLATEPAKS